MKPTRPLGRWTRPARAIDLLPKPSVGIIAMASVLGLWLPSVSDASVTTGIVKGADGISSEPAGMDISTPGALALQLTLPAGENHSIASGASVIGGNGGNASAQVEGELAGDALHLTGTGAVTNQGTIQGGNGGRGGLGAPGFLSISGAPGGNGGLGGAGMVLTAASLTNYNVILGGGGGQGGNITGQEELYVDPVEHRTGNGGNGAPGVLAINVGSIFNAVGATIKGGSKGVAGYGLFPGVDGQGGSGIQTTSPITITNEGTIEGAPNAVRHSGGSSDAVILKNSGLLKGGINLASTNGASVILSGAGTLNGDLDLGSSQANTLTLATTLDDVSNPGTAVTYHLTNEITGSITLGGTLKKTGNSIWVINKPISSAASTQILGGKLIANGSNQIGGELRITNDATFDLAGNSQQLHSLGALNDRIVGNVIGGTVRLVQNGNAFLQKGTISANLANAGSSARIWIGGDEAATVTLSGTNDVVYEDHNPVIIGHSTTGPAGFVKIGAANALLAGGETAQIFAGTLDLNGQQGVRGNGILLMDQTSAILINGLPDSPASFQGGVHLVGTAFGNVGGDGALVISGGLHGTGGLNKIGNGTLYVGGVIDYSGPVTISQGTYCFASDSSSTWSQAISGAGELRKMGNGSLTLQGNNSHSGGTLLESGFLGLGSNSALGTGPLTILGGEIHAVNSDRNISNATTLGGDFILGRVTNITGPVHLDADVTITSGNPDVMGPVTSTISGVISGSHNIRFTEGANPIGAIILSGVNNYTGGTVLLKGKVIASHSTVFPDQTDLSIVSGATLQLNGPSGTPDQVRTLRLNGQLAAPGLWGAPGSGATFTSPLLEGSGRLLVAAASPYEAWSQSIADSAKRGPNLDADGDGVSNLFEYAFGLNPNVPQGGSLNESDGVLVSHGTPLLRKNVGSSGSQGIFLRRKDREGAGLAYVPQFSEDLTAWQDSPATPTVIAEDDEVEVVSIPWPATPPSGKFFFRVKVTLP